MQDSVQQSINQQTESLPEMSRLEYLLRVHWLGRLVSLALLSALLLWLASFVIPAAEFSLHWYGALIAPSLLLSRWFGLGCGGLLGLRLSWRNVRLIVFAAITAAAATGIISGAELFNSYFSEYSFEQFLFVGPRLPFMELLGIQAVNGIGRIVLLSGIPLIVLASRFGETAAIFASGLAGLLFVADCTSLSAVGLINHVLYAVVLSAIVLRSRSFWFPLAFDFVMSTLGSAMVTYFMNLAESPFSLASFSRSAANTLLDWIIGRVHLGAFDGLLMTAFLLGLIFLFVPRLERLRDPVLAARDFRRRLREARLATVHGR